jgi:hypothetical protein
MIKPLPVLANFAAQPFRKFSKMIDKLSVQVLNAPLNLALVLPIRRIGKMSLNTMLTTETNQINIYA